MTDTTRRLYHPSLPIVRDVPIGDVEKWAEQGWRKSKAKGIEVDDTVPVLTADDLPK